MKLNARTVDTSKKAKDKAYKLSDGGGLYLLVNTNGSRYWRLKYRFAGKEKLLALGGGYILTCLWLMPGLSVTKLNVLWLLVEIRAKLNRQRSRLGFWRSVNSFEALGY
ncbi:hypothetical protein E05_32640 [Plautia stali symbiont]|nr:hypothetical protein E05_32640 [Plautia stali symbiont]